MKLVDPQRLGLGLRLWEAYTLPQMRVRDRNANEDKVTAKTLQNDIIG